MQLSTVVGTWTQQNAQAAFYSLHPTLTRNAPTTEDIEGSNWSVEIWQQRGRVLSNIPCSDHRSPRLGTSFLPRAFAHIITRRAFGDLVPEVWDSANDGYECSHLCECPWRRLAIRFSNHRILRLRRFLNPSRRCVNPLHLVVERRSVNQTRALVPEPGMEAVSVVVNHHAC